ncbi:Interferon- developmental regulator 1 [Coemansia furcata]|uniref:Interferon- developmental regulator 1 n=1 Tax=Coemansia furcata TaxID=417177 RepID=A0ACC1LRV8_9FUNG|nr:Interferon- developmental regulator 1 [Coemansia furcata]
MSGTNTNELLRAALNAGRVPSSGGRSAPGSRSSRKATPKSPRSVAASRDVSDVEDNDDDDNMSIASDDTWVINETSEEAAEETVMENTENWQDILQSALDTLGEKRVGTRERGLATVAQVMAHVYVGEAMEGRRLASLESLKRCAKAAKSQTEGMLALRGIALWFVNFGIDASANEYTEAKTLLKTLARDHHLSPHVRVMALAALGVSSFVSGADYNDAAEVLKFVGDHFIHPDAPPADDDVYEEEEEEDKAELEPTPASVMRQALETYGFLMTVVVDANPRVAENMFDRAFDAHLEALAADSIEIRLAAAQNFALIHSELARQGSHFEFDRQEELVATLSTIRHQSSKRHGRRDTQMQRQAVRGVLQTIEAGEAPELKLAFHGRSVRFADWPRILRLHAFRAVLGGGINSHFVDNPLLGQVFEVVFDTSADNGSSEARMVVNPNSSLAKARTVNMRKKREARNSAKRLDEDSD